MDELVHQARLPHAGLSHHGYHLAMPVLCLLQRVLQGYEFRLAPDEAPETARHRRLEALADRIRTDDFIDLYRLCQAFDRHWPEGIDADQALHSL